MNGSLFVVLAMALDTLPVIGRVLLLAFLLSVALCGFLFVLPDERGSTLQVLYRKGALLALVMVPLAVYVLGVHVPVPVVEVVRLATPWPGYVVNVLCGVWLLGVLWHFRCLLSDLRLTSSTGRSIDEVQPDVVERARHWQQRLNLNKDLSVRAGGARQGWHVDSLRPGGSAMVVLPAAALNWPAGLLDVMLLKQLAQLYQGSWRWLVFGRMVQALYWPAPWVAMLVRQLAENFEIPGLNLAAAAYRDPEGWQRDVRNLEKRASTLQGVPTPVPGEIVCLPNDGAAWIPPRLQYRAVTVDGATFEDRWQSTKRQKKEKERDPHEQAYWLIALASLAVGVATTLTLVQAPPEFEPRYLNIRWQDQMLPRMREYAPEEPTEHAPLKKPPPRVGQPVQD